VTAQPCLLQEEETVTCIHEAAPSTIAGKRAAQTPAGAAQEYTKSGSAGNSNHGIIMLELLASVPDAVWLLSHGLDHDVAIASAGGAGMLQACGIALNGFKAYVAVIPASLAGMLQARRFAPDSMKNDLKVVPAGFARTLERPDDVGAGHMERLVCALLP